MSIGTSQAFRTQNLRLLGNLFDKNNFIGKKGYYLNSTGDGVDWRADLNESSGIFYGGVISATFGGTTFNLSAGSGQIITRALVNNDIVTTNKIISWNAQSNVALTNRTTHQFSYLYIDENGVLQQQTSNFTDAEYKNKIILAVISHINYSTINLVINKQNTAYADSHRIYELANSFGPIKRSGLNISAYSTDLRITRGAGSVFSIGCNYASDQFEADSPDVAAANPALLDRIYRNGSGGFIFDSNSGSFHTNIDPTKYDNGSGTLQTVNNNQWTIQRLFFFPINVNEIVVYYGDAIYNSSIDAIAAISTEFFSESVITSENAVFLGYLILRGGATDLSLSSDATFFQSGAFRSAGAVAGGGIGSAVTNLDDLTDVEISSVLGGQFLTYDSTTSFWKNRSFILDANNNELIKFPSTVASAVNELTISNAAATGSPSISATGDDTNIGLNLISKGTGLIQINGKAISLANSFTTIGNFSLAFTTTASTSLTLPTSGLLATTDQIPTVNNATLTLAGSGGIGIDSPPTFTANASADKTITISIADGALAIAKLADIATLRILGRTSASTGPVQELDGTGVVAVIGSSAVSRAVNIAGGIAGQIPYQSGANTTLFSAAGTANQVLLSGGTSAPTWANQSSLSVGSATTAGSLANALTISSPLTGTSYNGSSAVSIGLQNASDSQAGGVSIGAQTFAGNKTFKDNVIISGDLTVNGSTVTINSSTLSVDDKNIELGAVIAIASLSSTNDIEAGSDLVIVNSTTGLIVGQALTKTGGTGAFGASPTITSIISATQFTVAPVHATTGSIIFSVGGATDVTADGGGITLKGTTNKTIIWVDSTNAWTLSEHLNIASGKVYRINGNDVLSSTTLGSGVVNSSLTSVGTLTNLTVTNTITGSVSGSAGSLSGTYTFWGQSFNGTQNVSGNLTSVGNITGTSGITVTAGGSNQNVVLTPSGTGYTLLNGSVGIGNSTPNNKLTIQAGDNKDSGPIINLGGNAINQFESGRIRFTEVVTGTAPFYQGAYLHYDGSNNLFHIGVHDTNDSLIESDVNAISIVRSDGSVGVGTTSPLSKLDVRNGYITSGTAVSTSGTTILAGYYSSGHLTVLGTEQSSGGPVLGYAVTPSTSTTGAFLSSTTIAIPRSAYTQDGGTHRWYIGASQTVAIGSSVAASEVMRININGNVGIGTTNPLARLSVGSGSLDDGNVPIQTSSLGSNTERWIGINKNGAYGLILGYYEGSGLSGVGAYVRQVRSDPLYFLVNGSTMAMSIVNNGNIGIGNAPANNKLAVSGSVSIGSNYNVAAPANGLIVEGNVAFGLTNPSTYSSQLTIETTQSRAVMAFNTALADAGTLYGLGFGYAMSNYNSAYLSFYKVGNSSTSNRLSFSLWNQNDILNINGAGNVGIGITIPTAKLHINSTTSGATLLRADGTNGTLFSVVDDLSDSLMSVNNSAGLPVLEVFADDRIVAGQYGQNDLVVINNKVGIGTANPINKLSVIGAANIGDSTYNVAAPTNGLIVQGDVGIGTATPTAQSNYRFLQVNGPVSAIIETTVAGVRIGGFDSTSNTLFVGTIGAFPIVFRTGVNEKWRITNAGVLQSSTAQTIQTATGILTLATLAGDGHIVLSPHGNGNVGIGTATPGAKLEIAGFSTGAGLKLNYGNSSGTIEVVNFIANGAANGVIGMQMVSAGVGDLWLGGSGGRILTLYRDGSVGIGITSPAATLDVNGTTFLRGNLDAGRTANLNTTTALNGTGGGNRGFDTSFTGASSTGFTGTDNTDQGFGYFAATIVSGRSYEVSATMVVTNGAPLSFITSSGLNFATQTVQSIISSPVSNTIYRFVATADAAFFGIGINRTSGTMTAVVSNFSIKEVSILVTSNSNVGIVTTSPTNTLDVNGSARVRSISASASQATKFLTTDADGVLISRTAAQVRSDIGAGTGNGSVTSVSGAGNVSGLELTGTVTTTGSLTLGGTLSVTPSNFASQTANTFLAAPNGAAGAPTFRAMVSADIPSDAIVEAKIANNAVTFAKIQNVTGPVVVGRLTATSGVVSALSSSDGRSALGATTVGANLFTLPDTSTSKKYIEINANNTVTLLEAAAFRTAIGAGTVTSVTGTAPIASSEGTTPVISLNDAGVTYAKIQNVSATSRILGRISSNAGVIEELNGANVATIIGASAIENATNVNITTDDATNSSYYLYFGANASGNTPLKASTKIRYNPSSGAFSATTKSFRISHPTKPEHDLVYGSLESPYHGIRLTGKGKTKGNRAEIILPDYVKVLIDKETINIQLSVIKCAKILYIDDIIIDDNKFTVKYDKSWYEKSKDVEFYWDFTAERKDVPKLIVEEKL